MIKIFLFRYTQKLDFWCKININDYRIHKSITFSSKQCNSFKLIINSPCWQNLIYSTQVNAVERTNFIIKDASRIASEISKNFSPKTTNNGHFCCCKKTTVTVRSERFCFQAIIFMNYFAFAWNIDLKIQKHEDCHQQTVYN
jgi:hypothetical protein